MSNTALSLILRPLIVLGFFLLVAIIVIGFPEPFQGARKAVLN